MSPTTAEKLATLEAQGKHQNEKLEEFRVETREDIGNLRLEIAKARLQISEIKDILTQAQGGWKAVMLLGGAAGFVISALWWLFNSIQPLINVLPR